MAADRCQGRAQDAGERRARGPTCLAAPTKNDEHPPYAMIRKPGAGSFRDSVLGPITVPLRPGPRHVRQMPRVFSCFLAGNDAEGARVCPHSSFDNLTFHEPTETRGGPLAYRMHLPRDCHDMTANLGLARVGGIVECSSWLIGVGLTECDTSFGRSNISSRKTC